VTQNVTSAHCNYCGGTRKHTILHTEVRKEFFGPTGEVWWKDSYEMLECRGCQTFCLRHQYQHSDEFIQDYDDAAIHTNYYPPSLYRKLPKWFEILENSGKAEAICGLVREIYSTIQNDSLRLATMGLRSLVEHIMIDKIGDHKSFEKNLQKFHDDGYISQVQKDSLAILIETGHAVTHRSYMPSRDDLASLLDIAESIIETIYVNQPNISSIKDRIPPRRKAV